MCVSSESAGMQSWFPTSFWTRWLAVGMWVGRFSCCAFALHLCWETVWGKGLWWRRGVGGGSALSLSEISGKLIMWNKKYISSLPPYTGSVSWLCTQTSSWARDLLVKCSLKRNGALAYGKLGMGELDWGCSVCSWGCHQREGGVSLLSCWNWGDVGLQRKVQTAGSKMEENEPQP